MRDKQMDQLIGQMESYLECWKQFNQYVNIARTKKFGPEEDRQFLETKSVIVQQLEVILSAMEVTSPTKEEIHTLVGNAPSLRYLSELSEGALRNLENQWHRVYIGWHAILGQLKVRQLATESQSGFGSLFGRRNNGKHAEARR
jgi:hypothetical protein